MTAGLDDVFNNDERTVDPHRPNSARELIAGTCGSDPYEAIQELREAGRRKAKAAGVCFQLEKERHVVLAQVASSIAAEHPDYSEAKLTRLARASKRYHSHVVATAAATEELELAGSEYWAIRSELEWDKTAVAHTNAMSRLEEPL